MAGRKELADHLGRIALFSRCTRAELKTVARHVEVMAFDVDQPLMVRGDEGDALFVILEGTVCVSGRNGLVLGPGDFVGELALLDRLPRTATVTAQTPVTAAVLGIRMFRTLVREFPAISEAMLAALAQELRAARVKLHE